jgi:hypothetical protein
VPALKCAKPSEDRIAVVDQELLTMVTGNDSPELLQCPVCGGMRGHVVVQNTAADFHHEIDGYIVRGCWEPNGNSG